jgi:hypothetical protein
VDNVDNLFLDCPHDPQRERIFARERKGRAQSVDNVDNVDNDFKSLAYNIVSMH